MRAIVVAALLLAGCGAEPVQKDEPVAKATDATLPLSSPVPQAQIDVEKGPVILHCRGSDGQEVRVYRLNGAKGTFETWDSVKFVPWDDGRLTVNSDYISYLREDKHGDRLVEIIRSTGAIEDTSTYRTPNFPDTVHAFTGTCDVGEEPKPIERKF